MKELVITPRELLEATPNIATLHGVHKFLKDKDISSVRKDARKFIAPTATRKYFEQKGFKYPKKNIAFHIIKGGVGKSSLASAFAIRSVQLGVTVLCVDVDQQGNLTKSLGVDGRNKPTFLNIVKGDVTVNESVEKVGEGLYLIPSSMVNSRLDIELTSSSVNIGDCIRDILNPIRDAFDIVVFDCPPSLNKITSCVSCASDLVVMPINSDIYSFDALNATVEELENLSRGFRKEINYKILWNKYDQREKLSIKYLHQLASIEKYNDKILPVVIRTDANIKNAIDAGLSVFEIRRKTPAKEDIDSLAKELIGFNRWMDNLSKAKLS